MITSRSRADPAASSISVAAVPPTYVASKSASASRSRLVRCARPRRCPDPPRAPRRSAQDRPRPGPGSRRRRPPRTRSSSRTASGSSRVITTVGIGEAGRERLGQPLARADRLRLVQELVGLAQSCLHLGQPERESAEHEGADHDGGAGPAVDDGPDPVPQGGGVDQGRLAEPRHQRPEDPSAAQHEHAGQHHQGRGGRDHDADGAGQAERAGRREDREQQGQQADDHGRRAREHRLAGRRPARDASRRTGPRWSLSSSR